MSRADYSQSGDYHVRAEEPATLAEWVRREGQAAVASLPEAFFGEDAAAYRRCAEQLEKLTRGESLPEWPAKGGQP